MRPTSKLMIVAALLALSASAADAFPLPQQAAPSGVTPVAQGCGAGAWRGPWGHCRDTIYHGPLPGGGWK